MSAQGISEKTGSTEYTSLSLDKVGQSNNSNNPTTVGWLSGYTATVIGSSAALGILLCGIGAAGFAIGSDYTSSQNHTVDDFYYENMMFAASIGAKIGLFFGAGMGAVAYPLLANYPTT